MADTLSVGLIFSVKEIRIACQGAELVPFEKLRVIQGDLKELSKADFAKLEKEILTLGFSFPFNVWKNPDGWLDILDGTQRFRVVSTLRDNGYSIPQAPVSFVEASSREEAANKLLGAASAYGKPNSEGLYAFMHDFNIELPRLDSVDLPGVDIEDFKIEYFESGSENNDAEVDDSPVPFGGTSDDTKSTETECPRCRFRW